MPKNTTFLYMPILTQRNPALWGEDADQFDPERWLAPERLAQFVSDPMMYTPFSAGPRIVSGPCVQLPWCLVLIFPTVPRSKLCLS